LTLVTFLPLLFFLGLLALFFFLLFVLPVRVLAHAYRKIGVRPQYMFLILLLTLLGQFVNVPIFSLGRTLVAINIGGALLPILLSLYLFTRLPLRGRMLIGTLIVTAIVHSLARIVPGVGIGVPWLIPPLTAAGVGLLLSFRQAPPVAYVAGSMGTLIGADILNLHRIAEIGVPVVSIGGSGTFDAVFLTGIIAGLLV
jgi:uncharacterized membrane protein